MLRAIMTAALAMFAFAGIAQAEEIRIGQGTVRTGDSGYIDTYPGQFCGVKAIRIDQGRGYGDHVGLGRVYFSYTPNQPWIFSAYTHATNGWIKVPQMGGCLQRVRVYVDARQRFPDDGYQKTHFITVYGVR